MFEHTDDARLGAALIRLQRTVCVAESCTGGLIGHRLTNIPGSSAYMLGGIIAYANSAKQMILHVPESTLIAHGAVSEPTAREMAISARAMFGADYALSVTGIAGPGGGTAEKPVGLTYIGIALPEGEVIVERHIWQGDREANKHASASAALALLWRHLPMASDG